MAILDEAVEAVKENTESINGVVQREDRFVIWIEPEPINRLSDDEIEAVPAT